MKKTTIVSLFFILFSNYIFSQTENEKLKNVDKIIRSYHNILSIEELAKRIDYDFNSEIEKARAIYTWLAINIEYDDIKIFDVYSPEVHVVFNESDYKRRLNIEKNNITIKAFKKKKGVCKEYAYLFEKICNLLHIKNELIYGYTRTNRFEIGVIPKNKNHIWNAVYINKQWLLIDITFGSGYLYKDVWQKKLNVNYFNISKNKMRLTHYPNSNFWVSFLNQKPLKDFCNQPIISSGYINKNTKIISPINGEIKTRNRSQIKLRFKDLPTTTKVYYLYNDNKYLTETVRTNNNSISNIKLPKPSKNSSLKIYFNNELALEYNVIVSK